MTVLTELQQVLDAIEGEEAKLLTWGDTGGRFSEEEILVIIEKILPLEDPEEVFDGLESHAMLIPVIDASGRTQGFRSRMGEAIHLYRNLRQWFHEKSIEQSSTLVSDYRFLRRHRQYPKRNLLLSELVEDWSSSRPLSDSIKLSLKELVGEYKLSGFQSRATERILSAIQKHKKRTWNSSATIICSGTGSGKTMAFYLPALSSLVADLLVDSQLRVRVLAIYPRKELLKDQFNEAWEQCRKLDKIVQSVSGRVIRIGAMFGDTPDQAKYALKGNKKYLSYGLLKCATQGCDGEMRWGEEDIKAEKEQLKCHICGHSVSGGEVVLTRREMVKSPPDILFTTTEMLNQQMGNPYRQKLFGIGIDKPIPLVLLDEVHTYGGNQGAQTAFLLRRWMKLSNCAPHFVGLSATLSDAESYFSRLTGTNPSRVRLVEPLQDEIMEEGAEYLLALRGDPVSQTALLSTTIQAAMLTRRLQDQRQDKISQNTWGSKTFIFTDDLDVNNRLFSQLADAEGWVQQGGQLIPKPPPGPLAQLRNPVGGGTTRQKLIQYGQDWSAVKTIGFGLNPDDRAIVSRTSSQDAGVDAQAEIVVATASLEVGFNDPEVGAIIQHKAPRDFSSYLQRKGRAGRLRNMRPWMLIVLSEYGRDRVTYQHYERLLDPEIKLQSLPVGNSHIQRMQAAMATLDWLGTQVEGFNPWLNFNKPRDLGSKKEKIITIVNELLEGGRRQAELSNYLSQALAIDEQGLNQLLWQPPRSIFMEFLPTLRLRLETNWGRWSYDTDALREWMEANQQWGSPVPEFIPDNLFSDLNLPTLHVALSRGVNTVWEGMRFFQGLREFAPGRISKRFSVQRGQLSDWLVPKEFSPKADLHNTAINFELDHAFGEIRTFIDEIDAPESREKLIIYQPHRVMTFSTSKHPYLAETSNAMLNWHSIFRPSAGTVAHSLPKGSSWESNFLSVTFYTHRSLTQLEVIRYNTGSSAELKFRNGQKAKVDFNWQHEGQAAGVGARLWVDAARMEFQVTADDLVEWLQDASLIRVLRNGYLQDKLCQNVIFEGNKFKSDWIFECFIGAIALEVIHSGCNITVALENICKGGSAIPLSDIPEILFQQDFDIDGENGSGDANSQIQKDQKLQSELKELLVSKTMLSVLRELGTILTVNLEEKPEFLSWCCNVIGNTLAAATQQAVCTLLPDVDEREIVADPVFQGENLTIWLSEQDSGGTGVIAQLQDSYAEDPLRMLNILSQAIQPSDYEQLDYDLHALLCRSRSDNKISGAIKNVRDAENYHQRFEANKRLKRILTEAGFQYSHSFSAVLYSRILRPGSGHDKDLILESHLERWQELEEQLGFELPMNIIALVISVENNPKNPPLKIFSEACKIQSVLWPRGNAVRQAVLAYYNPFQVDNNRTERLLVGPLCSDATEIISCEGPDWLSRLHESLAKEGKANLLLPREMNRELTSIVATLHVMPLDTLGLLFYPRVSSIKRRMSHIILCVELAEAIQ